jgi:phosphatidylinositol-3,4,5-trisphosphate 3-phosphatase/dual-specificity protein phosphatase PTEN
MIDSTYDALKYYGIMRCKNKKGVTIPSQIRYISYFERALKWGWTENTIP